MERRRGIVDAPPELRNNETPEYDEEGLQDLVDLSVEQVSAGESRVLNNADTRLTSLSEIVGEQRAESILAEHGFADRIKVLKDKIINLSRHAQERISTLPEESIESKNVLPPEDLPIPESETSESHQTNTLDQYAEGYHANILEAARDHIWLARLKLKGIENPERVMDFMHYVEEKVTERQNRQVTVKTSDIEIEQAKYEKRGYQASIDSNSGNKTTLNLSREVPVHFNMHHAKAVSELVGSKGDPVEFFEQLKSSFGYKVSYYNIVCETEQIKAYLDNHEAVIPLLEKLKTMTDYVDIPQSDILLRPGTTNWFIKLAKDAAENNALNEVSLGNIAEVSRMVGQPIELQRLKGWLDIIGDQQSMALLQSAYQLSDKRYFSSAYLYDYVKGNIEQFKNAGNIADVASLIEEGFDPKGFGLNNLCEHYMSSEFIGKLNENIKQLKENPALKKYLVDLSAMLGVKPSLEPELFADLQSRFLKNTPEESIASFMQEQEFKDFLSRLKEAGYKPSMKNMLDERNGVSSLYNSERFRQLMAKDRAIELAKHLNFFDKLNSPEEMLDDMRIIDHLAYTPDSLENLQRLENNFSTHWDITSFHHNNPLLIKLRDKAFTSKIDDPAIIRVAGLISGEQIKYTLKGEEFVQLIELADQDFADKLADPEIQRFFKEMSAQYRLAQMKSLCEVSPQIRGTIEVLAKEFNHYPKFVDQDKIGNLDILSQLSQNPGALEIARVLKEEGISTDPVYHFDSIRTLQEKNLSGIITQLKGFDLMQDWIFRHADLMPIATMETKLPDFLNEAIEAADKGAIRDRQMIRGELVGILIKGKQYGILAEIGTEDEETSESTERNIEKLQSFVDAHSVSGKGQTIATLIAMREYKEGENFPKMLEQTSKRIEEYEQLLENHSPHNIPEGLRASIGMEYEITKHTAEGYAESHDNHSLGTDMRSVSNFANLGRGTDAVFEIATKPVDNPYLMLLEMQLLQDLEFIDFNFSKEGYEQGARGYHMTIGGEYGINASKNANFLQNMLVVSGWGGINAGKEVARLSKGRKSNCRERDSHNTTRVFNNTKSAVEFRALSLDSWEPFERTVETSYYGAIAIQAFEKHISVKDPEMLVDVLDQSSSAEQFYELLEERGLIVEKTENPVTKQIIFEWISLQGEAMRDVADHNENFLQNERYGYQDDRGRWIDAQDFGGASNAERFSSMAGGEQELKDYTARTHINVDELFSEVTPELANKLTAITNLFVKSTQESGGDTVNASSILDTTKIGRSVEEAGQRYKRQSFFDTKGKTREGYYYVQGGSEKMLLHQAQVRLLRFNGAMKKIIS